MNSLLTLLLIFILWIILSYYSCAFGQSLNLPPANVASVTGTGNSRNPANDVTNGTINIADYYSNNSANQLPQVNGLHLLEGINRKAGAAPQVYPPGEPSLGMNLVQWDKQRFPLKIWISLGKKLPEIPFNTLKDTRPDEVYQMLANPNSIWELPEASGWSQDMNTVVANGFEQWREFENEGLISFGFVDRPQEANILVFFTDHFVDDTSPGGISAHGITCAQVFDVNIINNAKALQKPIPKHPVVIELKVNPDLYQLAADATHEFGHALGIKAHSPFREDIMYENRQVPVLSPSDKATLRWLYHQKPQYLME
jgi:predicted Zn-dependent protease